MKHSTVGFTGVVVLVGLLVLGFIVVQPALAQVATSSTDSTTSVPVVPSGDQASTSPDTATTPTVEGTSTATVDASNQNPQESEASTPTEATSTAPSPSASTPAPIEAPPEGLTEVHIIGTKYIDYFTDGKTTFSFPGDPAIDSHFAEKDAPIPEHEGLTWVHTIGQNLYDTPSGDLEVGQYAAEPTGAYIENRAPFVSATSSPVTSAPVTEASTATTSSAVSDAATSSEAAAGPVPVASGAETEGGE